MSTKPTYYECGVCDHLHPVNWDGDCREDTNRFTADVLDEKYGALGWDSISMEEVDDWRANHNGWVEWKDGVEPPVAQQDRVSIRQRGGNEFDTDNPHSWRGWVHTGASHDIVAYKILKEASNDG